LPVLLVVLGIAPPLTSQSLLASSLAPIDGDLLARLSDEGTADLFVRMSAQSSFASLNGLDWQTRGEVVWDALNRLAGSSQAPVLAYARDHGLKAHSLALGNVVYVRDATLQAAREMAALSGVAELRLEHSILLDSAAQPIAVPLATPEPGAETAWGVGDVHAPELWSMGIRGAGVRVAAIDTGVQWDHPALVGQYGCPEDPGNAACWYDPSSICGGLPCDNNGHGTFTLGQIAASDDPSQPYIAGLAPDTTWIACKGCESNSCSEFALQACAQWALAPGGDPSNRPHVLNFPLGGASCDDYFMPWVLAWQAAGITPVSKIGSGGPGCATASSPGDYLEVIGAGAYDIDRAIASFTARGPSCFGETAKPNLVAPGVEVCSTYPGNGWTCSYSGTAMASSYTAGGVVLLLSGCPDLAGDFALILQTLQEGADEPPEGNCGIAPGGGNYTFGHGYLNALASVLACAEVPSGTLEGQVVDQQGLPLDGIAVNALPETAGAEAGAEAITDPDGFYSMQLAPGTYSVAAGGGACDEQSVPGVEIVSGETTVLDFTLTCAAWQDIGRLCFDWTRFDGEYMEVTGKVYFLGGRSGTSTVGDIYAYDPATGACAGTGASMPVPISNYTASFVKVASTDLLCTFGGRASSGSATPEVQCYDPVANSAHVRTLLPDEFDGYTPGGQAVIDNMVYVFGGLRTTSAPYTTAVAFRYDPQTDAWTQLDDLSLGRGYIMVAPLEGKVYAFGGDTYDGTSLVARALAEVLDPATGTWDDAAVADLPAASGEGRAFGFDAIDGYALAGQIVLAGGGQWPDETAEVLTYELATDSYDSTSPDLNVARRDHAGFFVPGTPGRMWVVGGRCLDPGCGGDSPPYAPAERYEVNPIVHPTMHVAAIDGYFALDPMGRTLLRCHVQVVDESGIALGGALIKAAVTSPDGEPAVRSRLTKSSGYARFHWGCNGCLGSWVLCVDQVEKEGYQYEPGDNVVTCQNWENR